MADSINCVKYLLGLFQPVTQTSVSEREVLSRHARGRKSLVEIGVYHGVNTRAFREVADPSGVLYAVDPFFRGRLGLSFSRVIARSNIAKSKGCKVKWIRDVSPHAASTEYMPTDTRFDFVFIDGDHSYEGVALDWNTWAPRIQIGGVVALHDSRGNCGAESEKFTSEIATRDPHFELADAVDSLTVLQRRA